MDNFKVGDKIIYPNQGLGVIEDVQAEKHFGREFIIYSVRILSNNALVKVPYSNFQEVGIRKPISEQTIENIFELMRNGDVNIISNWKGRYKEHSSMLKSGGLNEVALVFKSLYCLNHAKPLSFREKKMMEKAKDLLVTEISEVTSLSCKEIEQKLLSNLTESLKQHTPNLNS
ncbi:MAG: CarD family transcriptional regulator [Acidobacteriota bacterium]